MSTELAFTTSLDIRDIDVYTTTDKQDVAFCYAILITGETAQESIKNLRVAFKKASKSDKIKLGNVYAAMIWTTLNEEDKLKLLEWIQIYEKETNKAKKKGKTITVQGRPRCLSEKQCKLFLGYIFSSRFEVNVKICKFVRWKQCYPKEFQRLLQLNYSR